jgi:GT2 family glycosyltransferase
MTLSIIVINFNTPQITLDCLKSIYAFTSIDFEIIIVDNFPKTDYKPLFLQQYPKIIYLRSDENIGFGRANNLGMKNAKGDFLLLLNSDTLITDDSITACVNILKESKDNIGILGCKLLNADGSYQPSFYPFIKHNFLSYCISNNPILYKLFNIKSSFSERNTMCVVGDISGAFMLLKKNVYETTLGFDPDFFLYCEETEWCRNRIAKKFDIVYYPQATIIHLGGQSAPPEIMFIQAQISLGLYWYKEGYTKYTAFILFTLLNYLYYLLSYLFVSQKSKIEVRKLLHAWNKALPYWLFNIPKYSSKYNSRTNPIIYKGAKNIFFGKAE